MTLSYVLAGDCGSPHMLKWARALAPRVELYAVSARAFLPAFDEFLPASRRLCLGGEQNVAGGNVALLRRLPRFAGWLRERRPDVVHAHYLSSWGAMCWLAQRLFGVGGCLVGSAWGSDILVTPRRSRLMRLLTRRVLRACVLATSDSHDMAARMRELGAGAVMVFPFGLEAMPPEPPAKAPHAFFANRGIEPVYDPGRVVELFAAVAADWPDARFAVARDGPLMPLMRARVHERGLDERVEFVGFLEPVAHAAQYARSRWYVSLPRSDSVAVSVLEAMAHGCIPILSDLAANRELVESGRNGLVVADGRLPTAAELEPLLARGDEIAAANRAWVRENALFGPCLDRFLAQVERLRG